MSVASRCIKCRKKLKPGAKRTTLLGYFINWQYFVGMSSLCSSSGIPAKSNVHIDISFVLTWSSRHRWDFKCWYLSMLYLNGSKPLLRKGRTTDCHSSTSNYICRYSGLLFYLLQRPIAASCFFTKPTLRISVRSPSHLAFPPYDCITQYVFLFIINPLNNSCVVSKTFFRCFVWRRLWWSLFCFWIICTNGSLQLP